MFQKVVKENKFLIITVILTVFAIIPLFHPGFFPIHDDEQIGRLFELDQALRFGQFPVRITQNLGFGYGYLLFNFYPPLVYYLGEIFRLIHFSYIDSIKIVMALGFIFSAVFMYLFVKEIYGKAAGIVSSVFYTYAPYHSVDIYVRGALPEFFSFIFIPAIFWSYLKLSKESSKKYIVIASIFNFFLVITHNLVALMAALFIGIYVLFLLLSVNNKYAFFKNAILTLVFSLLLSSFFIFPAILENKYTMVSLLTTQLADYNSHFVYIRQFWNSPWGYGGSIFGLNDGLSFQIGKLHIIGALLSLFVALIFASKKKYFPQVFLFFGMFVISVFMQTFHSKFIWDNIKALSYIQFPWRYLLFSAFFSSFLVGFLVSQIKKPRHQYFAAIVLSALVIIFNFNYFKPKSFLNVNDSYFTNTLMLRWITSKMAFEYIPRGMKMRLSPIGNSIPDINQDQIAKFPYTVDSGQMAVSLIEDIPQRKQLGILVKKKGTLILNEFAYPGWQVFINKNKTEYRSNNKYKLISVDLKPGRYILDARFEDTKIRRFSNLLTFAGIILLLLYILPLNFKKYVKN